jgi:hypothetical protein
MRSRRALDRVNAVAVAAARLGALPGIAVVALLAWTPAATACSSCFVASDAARNAYYLTTVLLILVPFLLLGSILLWLRRAARRASRSQDLASFRQQLHE